MKRLGLAGWITAAFSTALVVLLLVAAVNGSQITAGTATVVDSNPQKIAIAEGDYTFAWFSDTQYYSRDAFTTFNDMTKWIVDNQSRLNIQYAFMTGDVVDSYDDTDQWKFADAAIATLDGKVPLILAAGNHDVDQEDLKYDLFTNHFGAHRYGSLSTYGDSYQNGEGRYDLLDVGNDHWLFLALGYQIDEAGIAWANSVLQTYPDRTAIVITHSFMDADGTLTDEGETLQTEVIQPNANVRLLLCGHKHGCYHTSQTFDDNGDGTPDRTVYEVLADYQAIEDDGSGYLVVIERDPSTSIMTFRSYSPTLDDLSYFDDDPTLEDFSIDL